ncbi:EAL domain-containing protein [Nevskia soli]|uniref:EAL domain-containing protein n=1 Tax=Nevskia soli TaxID=418856 RepID=UPI000AC65023|nr:EAL domain-containing protein [Nevskia soli]
MRRNPVFVQSLAAMLIGLGMLVMLGWIGHIAPLTTVLPGLAAMVFNTALSFSLLGCALFLHASAAAKQRPERASLYCAGPVLLLALANLAQIVSGNKLGINFPAFHAWNATGNASPGQMSPATTIALILASTSVLMLRLGRRRPYFAIARTLIAVVFAIGLTTVFGYAMKLEPLYSWYPMAQMALHTAIGTIILASALWLAWSEPLVSRTEARHIVIVGTTALVIVALLSAATGLWVLRKEGSEALQRNLQAAQTARADLLTLALEQRSVRAAVIGTQTSLPQRMRALAANPADKQSRLALQSELDNIAQFGFDSIELRSVDGARIASVGAPVPANQIELPAKVSAKGKASLAWDNGLALRNRMQLRDARGVVGEIVAEQRLPMLQKMLQPTAEPGRSGILAVCGIASGGAACIAIDGNTQPYWLKDRSAAEIHVIQAAMSGTTGTDRIPGDQGRPDMLAYGPVGGTGLISLVRLDAGDLYGPVRRGLLWGFSVVGLLVIATVAWLRGRVRAMAQRLVATEGRYKTVVESLHEGLVLQDSQSRILASNPAAARILGLAPDELNGRSLLDPHWQATHEDGSAWTAEDHPAMRTLRTGVAENGVIMGLRGTDGRLRWISVNTAPIPSGKAGKERAVITSFTDITEKRAAEQHARQLDQRFRMIVENVADYAIFMLGVDGNIVSWNRGAMLIKGYQAEEIIGRHFSVFYPEEDQRAGKTARELEIAGSTGRFEEEGWRLRKGGERFWAHVVINAVRDEQGRLIGFAKISRDLSERRRAEQQLARANILREAILEASPFSIISTDSAGLITAVNPAAERMLWYKAVELVGKATPALIHDKEEIAARAAELSSELGKTIETGFEIFAHKARFGVTEEHEWTYVRKDGSRFPVNLAVTALRDEHGVITGFVGIAYDITERKRREEYAQHVAHHDFLTGLPNRMLLQDRMQSAIQRARRERSKVAALMIDLDHFKRVNDSLGHHVGDQILKAIAERILACVRGTDTVARMGGDEFAVLLGGVRDDADIERVAKNLVERISAPIRVGEHELFVTPSIGISRYPEDGEDLQLLLMNADSAMYRAKAEGRHAYRLFSRDMEVAARHKMNLEGEMRAGLKTGQFKLHYQPQVSLINGEVIGMEALLRWNNPQRGMVPPADFIPVAEESGLIVEIGDWVLETACREAKELQRRTGKPLKLAVNLSPRQFRQRNLLDAVQSTLQRSGLAPEHLELEITEGILMDHTTETVERLTQLRAMGLSIAVDDFGVGFSSLSYITKFPISTLKIDRVFISKLPDSASDGAVTQAIIALAHSLHINVVAEGVETTEQLDYLRNGDCDTAQGYHLGKPVSQEQFSVQGYHFSKAVSMEAFKKEFDQLQRRGRSGLIA